MRCFINIPVTKYSGTSLYITDTLETKKQFAIQRFPLFRGYLICTAIHLVPQKQSVVERFPLLGELDIRGSAVYFIPV